MPSLIGMWETWRRRSKSRTLMRSPGPIVPSRISLRTSSETTSGIEAELFVNFWPPTTLMTPHPARSGPAGANTVVSLFSSGCSTLEVPAGGVQRGRGDEGGASAHADPEGLGPEQ